MPTLFSLSEGIRKCTSCPLYKGSTLAVPGEGPQNAKLMILGEAPGEEEDRQGLPFVGRSGKYLESLLKTAGINRKEVFITNAVKHRPSGNRTPKASEIKICAELWLDKQIGVIKPRLIILLGSVALRSMKIQGTVEKLHGKIIKKNGQNYFITFHPSAAMRFPQTRKKMESDFKRLEKEIKTIYTK